MQTFKYSRAVDCLNKSTGGDPIESYSIFKSRGERKIARYLESRGMAYQYEYPLAVVDRGQTRIWYPDFRLPEYGVIIEYFGMNGDPGYHDQMIHKMKVYRDADIEGIYLLESTLRGPWQAMVQDRIKQVLTGRLDRFHGLSSEAGGVEERIYSS